MLVCSSGIDVSSLGNVAQAHAHALLAFTNMPCTFSPCTLNNPICYDRMGQVCRARYCELMETIVIQDFMLILCLWPHLFEVDNRLPNLLKIITNVSSTEQKYFYTSSYAPKCPGTVVLVINVKFYNYLCASNKII